LSTPEDARLVPFPPQRSHVAWPTEEFSRAEAPEGVSLEALLEEAMDPEGPLSTTMAVAVVFGGELVGEAYGGAIAYFDREPEPVTADTRLISWSMAKSMLHSAIGILVEDGRLSLEGPAPVPEWSGRDDPRHEISIEDMLEMRDGLQFNEDYVEAGSSDVIEMLFGKGRHDMAAFAAGRPLASPPGSRFSYSSGTSNILAGILRRTLGGRDETEAFLRRHLFEPIGARSIRFDFDDAGTWVSSSFTYATALDYARFGLLQLRGGRWGDAQVISSSWVDHGRLPRSVDEDGSVYGAHWWIDGDEHGTFRASGYEGQAIVISPGLDLVVVRLGKTPEERAEAVQSWTRRVVEAFAAAKAT
jgi:CubicO group peptidase (beta-lactamase class C family)